MAFNIIIQLGAILAVEWEFRRKVFSVVQGLPTQVPARRFNLNSLIAFMPDRDDRQ
ncbi:undecaprenyl pyrophosphate phosphatase [Pseudomonas putida]|nr:undecaprenyl pyrophosphate phosphatase [Pseudomonas putida]